MKTTVKRRKCDLKPGDIVYCEFYPPEKVAELKEKYGGVWFHNKLREVSVYRLTMIVGFRSSRVDRRVLVLDYFGKNPEDIIEVSQKNIIMQPRAKNKLPNPLDKLASRRRLEEKIKTLEKNLDKFGFSEYNNSTIK